MPNTPRRLSHIFPCYDPPLYFVTFNINGRRNVLANGAVHVAFVEFARAGAARGISVGRYVIMPDHIHLFVHGGLEFSLKQWIRLLKRKLSESLVAVPPHWQEGFFDHLIRHRESYSVKWEYVRQNPVRAGLAAKPEEWPWQGEIVPLAVR